MTHKDDKNTWHQTDEPEPSEEELREARALGDSLDRVLAGDRPRDELSAAALMVQASVNEQPLEQRRRDHLVEQALDEAGARRRARTMRRVVPVVVALAASVLLVVTGGLLSLTRQGEVPPAASSPAMPGAASASVSVQTLSRPSDDLMGRPFKDRAGASRRLDTVFSDRMRGYRMVMLAERGQP